jgi:MerR family mercuric resistance operon transcriptional regulator
MHNNKHTIGEFAKHAEVGVETIRYYQRKELLAVPEKSEGGRRYGEKEVRRLRFIKNAQKAGFTLREIKELIALDSSEDHERAYQIASARLIDLEQKITDMQDARNRLKLLADECAQKRQGQCCAILEAFES